MRENFQGWSSSLAWNQALTTLPFKIPVALAMWNQVGSECSYSRHYKCHLNTDVDWHQLSSSYARMRFSAGTYTSYGSWFQLYPVLLHTSSMWIQPRCSVWSFLFLSIIPHTQRMPSFSVAFRQTRTRRFLVIHIFYLLIIRRKRVRVFQCRNHIPPICSVSYLHLIDLILATNIMTHR
jgi:hypothetical protein